uniref:Uncharacterized protein n=1 Tax=Arundo donax TaxID=35708 RepID=A0A0A9CM91_ARUDO
MFYFPSGNSLGCEALTNSCLRWHHMHPYPKLSSLCGMYNLEPTTPCLALFCH